MSNLVVMVEKEIASKRKLIAQAEHEVDALVAALAAINGKAGAPAKKRTATKRERGGSPHMPSGHYEAIVGSYCHRNAGRKFTIADLLSYAHSMGIHGTKGGFSNVVPGMVKRGWLERAGMQSHSKLYRRAVADPAKWRTLYADSGLFTKLGKPKAAKKR